jgi:uncharacterized protein
MRQAFAALLVVAGLAACPGGAAYADVAVPPLKARVTDLTGTLNAQQKGELESRIAAFESKRGSQMAVLMLPTTKPEEIEQYSIRVAEAWKIGRKKVDDGLILIVAKDDRRLRIEVGYGLEGAIPDSLAKRVIDERITPRFRAGDFYGGVRDGLDQLIRLAEGEKLPPPAAATPPSATQLSADESSNVTGFFLLAFGYMVIGAYFMKWMFGRLLGSIVGGALMGGIAWLAFGVVLAVVAFLIAFLVTFANTNVGRGGGSSSGSGGSWRSGSSSSWGGGSSSSGGFSGGGGGFGGGGASGSW